jgi:hypothetical protein
VRRDLAGGLGVSRQGGVADCSPSDLINESSIHEFIEQLGLCMMQPRCVAGNHIAGAEDAARSDSRQIRPHTVDPGGAVRVAGDEERACDRRTWRKNGKDGRAGTRRGRSRMRMPLISISHTFNTFLFRRFSLLHHYSTPPPRSLGLKECSSKYLRHVIRLARVCPG